ncbi:hypothetical protein ACHAXS_000137 [Conticribra weissflogii]
MRGIYFMGVQYTSIGTQARFSNTFIKIVYSDIKICKVKSSQLRTFEKLLLRRDADEKKE